METAGFTPNFCSKCGFNLKGSMASVAKPIVTRATAAEEIDEAPLVIDEEAIRKSIRIQVPRSGAVRFEDAIAMGGGEDTLPPRQADRSLPSPKSGADFTKAILKECSSARGNSKEVGVPAGGTDDSEE